jgi:hypothetical protein
MVDFTKHVKDWPAYLHEKLKSDWVLSPTCRENCECYFLRHWEWKYYCQQLNTDGQRTVIKYNGVEYLVLEYERAILADQVALSFRKPKPELNLPAYVLVKGIENKS